MEAKEFSTYLVKIGACQDARLWARGKTAREAWDTTDRPDWLLWWAGHMKNPDTLGIVSCACQSAGLCLHQVQDGELRPLQAIEAAEYYVFRPIPEAAEATWAAAATRAATETARAAWVTGVSPLALCSIIRQTLIWDETRL
jgi:hypothetical protein